MLRGISDGDGVSLPLRVTARSDNPSLIADPTVVYASPAGAGELRFEPADDQNGTAVVTVAVTDSGLDGNPATAGDNLRAERSLTVTVRPMNDPPVVAQPIGNVEVVENIAFRFTVAASTFADVDAGDQLTYAAELGNGLPLPAWLQFDNSTRSFQGTAPLGTPGVVALAVIATDTSNSSVRAEFTLTVLPNPVPWRNPVNAVDVLPGGRVIPQDVLAVVNFLNAHGSRRLPYPTTSFQPPPYVDANGDNVVAPVDALIVINYVNHQGSSASGEAEAVFVASAAPVHHESSPHVQLVRRGSPTPPPLVRRGSLTPPPPVRRGSPTPPEPPTAGLPTGSWLGNSQADSLTVAAESLPRGTAFPGRRVSLERPTYEMPLSSVDRLRSPRDGVLPDDLEDVLQVLAEDVGLRRTTFSFAGHRVHDMANAFPRQN
jgi:hypothetical protein